MGRRAAAFVMVLCSCTASSLPSQLARSRGPSITATPDRSPDALPKLRMVVSGRHITAGSCTRARVSVLGAAEVTRVRVQWRSTRGGWRDLGAPTRIVDRARAVGVCLGWTGGRVSIRATADGAAPSSVTGVRVDPAPWMRRLDRAIGDRALSASLVVGGLEVYGHDDTVARRPASNEKLLLSMTALDELGPAYRVPTRASVASTIDHGVVSGDLWLIGGGDPELGASDLRNLAQRLVDAGLTRVEGSVLGDTSAFRRDRNAPGWHPIALRYIGLPTALSFDHNVDANGFVFDPELRAAAAFSSDLRTLGVRIGARPGSGSAPADLHTIARVRSATLVDILRRQNVESDNLDAETLSKLLGNRDLGRGSIAGGAAVIQRWARRHGSDAKVLDASGLSYNDRITTFDLATLLQRASRARWGGSLIGTLPAPGEGTLSSRLLGLPVRAKTGTLIRNVSALSGYLRLPDGSWAAFSILSRLPKDEATSLEDAIVRAFASYRSTA